MPIRPKPPVRLLEDSGMMTPPFRMFCACSVLFFFLFTLCTPDDALCFDTDTLKTAGIVTGITIGAALVIVLVAGTMRDLKGDRGDEEEDDEVWSRSPVLSSLGYNYLEDPLFGKPPAPAEAGPEERLADRRDLEAFLDARIEGFRSIEPARSSSRDTCPFRLSAARKEDEKRRGVQRLRH